MEQTLKLATEHGVLTGERRAGGTEIESYNEEESESKTAIQKPLLLVLSGVASSALVGQLNQ